MLCTPESRSSQQKGHYFDIVICCYIELRYCFKLCYLYFTIGRTSKFQLFAFRYQYISLGNFYISFTPTITYMGLGFMYFRIRKSSIFRFYRLGTYQTKSWFLNTIIEGGQIIESTSTLLSSKPDICKILSIFSCTLVFIQWKGH